MLDEPIYASKSKGGISVFVLVVFAIVAIILQVYHSKITAPLVPGQVLSPGGWISRCGLIAWLPSCKNAYLQMGHDGILSLYDADGELEWKMEGTICDSEECISGLETREDGKLAIGGKVVQRVSIKKDADPISPWPFAEQPKLKFVYARK